MMYDLSEGQSTPHSYYKKKTFDLHQKSLPPDHLLLAMINNIDWINYSMKDYWMAVPYLERALKIQ